MPVIAFWIDDAMHILASEGTQKARNIAADDRCVIATGSTTLPSLYIVIEGRAEPITDPEAVGRVAGIFREKGWPLEVTGDGVEGPNAPTAGPPPYTFYRIVPSRVFVPGMTGMENRSRRPAEKSDSLGLRRQLRRPGGAAARVLGGSIRQGEAPRLDRVALVSSRGRPDHAGRCVIERFPGDRPTTTSPPVPLRPARAPVLTGSPIAANSAGCRPDDTHTRRGC
jgi:hypothetical protein